MPRPTRIQYENAFYHVMNRGRGHRAIFHNENYYQDFLDTMEEAWSRFDAVFHAYKKLKDTLVNKKDQKTFKISLKKSPEREMNCVGAWNIALIVDIFGKKCQQLK